ARHPQLRDRRAVRRARLRDASGRGRGPGNTAGPLPAAVARVHAHALVVRATVRARIGEVGVSAAPLLAVEGLAVHYPVRSGALRREVGRVRAVDGVDFEVGVGETAGIVGESGSGKTTVAKCLVRLVKPDAGRITLGGEDLLAAGGSRLRALR